VRVSQKLDYTLRGLVGLAGMPPGTTAAAGEIADRLGMPRRFLEQQFTAVAKRGLLTCRRGAGGGCSLARPAAEITVGDVVRAVQGTVLDVPSLTAATSELWSAAATTLGGVLDAATLSDLADRQAEIDRARTAMYYI
jgi:Rrf2 family protein